MSSDAVAHGQHGPRRLDETVPNAARLYDYFLGGSHNFEVDRQLAEKILADAPMNRAGAQSNRAFLRRAVRFMVSEGVDQFLDLGSGVPTAGYRAALASGSYVAISHPSADEAPPDVRAELDRVQAGYRHATEQFHVRGRAEFVSWFTGTELVDPGIVSYDRWRPDTPETEWTVQQRRINTAGYAAVGRIA